MSMKSFYQAAAEILAGPVELSVEEVAASLLRPPKPEMGDIGFPCFPLAKKLKKAPPQIAAEICSSLQACEPFSEIKPVGPYVNFVISPSALAAQSVEAAFSSDWGSSAEGAGRTVVIDYSSPNIAKPLAVHHLRSTMIGSALSRLYAACGWKVVTVNHLGDWGTNFGQLMVAYKIAENEGREVGMDIDSQLKLYVEFHNAAEAEKGLNEEARNWFKKLEDGDSEARKYWEVFRDESLKPLKKLYERLNVSFDYYLGESFFNDMMEDTAERIKSAGILEESDGALVVKLDGDGIDMPCLIRKSDGATTYATRDLSAAEYRHKEYGFDKCLYVVANQQELHFRQVFLVLDKMGYDWAKGCEHIKFGMLSLGPGIFGEEKTTGSTRKGQVVFLADVLDRAVEKARDIIMENARDDEVKAKAGELAEQIGVGSIIFTEFMQRRMKDVVFTWEKSLNMQGDSGPYLQYTHARLSSVVRKSGVTPGNGDVSKLTSSLERDVMMSLLDFSGAVSRAASENEPSMVAEYLLDLCAVFNRMYADKKNHQLITDDDELTAARVGLVEAVRRTLEKGLGLLGLSAPERM